MPFDKAKPLFRAAKAATCAGGGRAPSNSALPFDFFDEKWERSSDFRARLFRKYPQLLRSFVAVRWDSPRAKYEAAVVEFEKEYDLAKGQVLRSEGRRGRPTDVGACQGRPSFFQKK